MLARAIRTVKFFVLGALALFFVLFSVANRAVLSVSFFPLPYTADMPAFLFAMLCFTLGVLTAGLVLSLRHAKARHRFTQTRRRADALENELKAGQSMHTALAVKDADAGQR